MRCWDPLHEYDCHDSDSNSGMAQRISTGDMVQAGATKEHTKNRNLAQASCTDDFHERQLATRDSEGLHFPKLVFNLDKPDAAYSFGDSHAGRQRSEAQGTKVNLKVTNTESNLTRRSRWRPFLDGSYCHQYVGDKRLRESRAEGSRKPRGRVAKAERKGRES